SAADDYTYYRKKAALPDKPIARATVYISSAHRYELRINGTLVGKGPAFHYPEHQYYNGYDVTGLLQSNSPNQFAIFNHWFGAGQGRTQNARGVLMKAVIHHTDGSTTVVGTDNTWARAQATAWDVSQAPRPQGGEGVGYVERIDARNLMPNWHSGTLDDSGW